jgi:uncharacterized membrane protein
MVSQQQNRYLKPVVPIVVALIIALVLLAIGSLISSLGLSGQGNSTLNWGDVAKWGVGLLGGVLIAYVLYLQFLTAPIWDVNTRVVVYSAIGAALYGVFSWVTNVAALPAVSNVSLRPAIVIPVFFGFVFGPVVGFFSGFVGNVLGDALTGWGVYPVWDVGNGLIGLIPGLVLAFRDKKQSLDVLTWVTVAVTVLATILVFLNPKTADPFSGKEADFSGFWWVPLAGAVLVLVARYWLAGRNVDLAAIAVWGTLAIVVGIGFAALLDIYVNGYSFVTAFVGEFVPAGGSDILNAVILAPILLAAWNAARAQSGR